MIRRLLRHSVGFVTKHNRITIVLMALLTGIVLAGIPMIDTASQAGGTAEEFDHLEEVAAAEYVQTHYGNRSGSNTTVEPVYVHDESGNVLSKQSLIEGLRYQQDVRSNDSLLAALHGDGIRGIENLVATRAVAQQTSDRSAEQRPDLSAQIRALEAASSGEVRQLLEQSLAENPEARRFLPADHEDATTATDRRMVVVLRSETGADTEAPADPAATRALYDQATQRSDFFTLGPHAMDSYRDHFFGEMVELVLPLSLLIILVVLAVSYRDLVDIVVGMTGVVLSVLWMFGLLGWLGVGAGTISIIPVVLVTGLSIDFGFHVFNRYREERGECDDIRDSMARGVRLVATALVLVTVTAAIAFLSNVVNPLAVIRDLGISITLGVVSSFVLFLTVVPAMKVSIDGLLERVGIDRHKQPLGRGRYLQPLLERNVQLAHRAAPYVLAVALVVGAAGGLAWSSLDQESYQQSDGEVADWKQQLPGPLGWDTDPFIDRHTHVEDTYQPVSDTAVTRSWILLKGDVTQDETLEAIHEGTDRLEAQGLLLDRPGQNPTRSPLTALRGAAERNESVAAAIERRDTDGNGVPDTDLESLYDLLYDADSETAGQVIERTDGTYRSVLVSAAIDTSSGDTDRTIEGLESSGTAMEDNQANLDATVTGDLSITQAIVGDIVDGILLTMVVALLAIVLTLSVVFWLMHGSASLGIVVSIPIGLVIGFVVGGMHLLGIPLTVLTALLMSLVVGLGVDYNIHVGDRYADERRAGKPPLEALRAAVTGTGGALFGSTLTTTGAYATIVLIPDPQFQSNGTIAVIALLTAFLCSVLVLPSLLLLWERYWPESVVATSKDAIPAE